MMGMNNRQFTDKENAKKLFKTFNEVYKTGEPAKEFDWQIIRKDGTKRYIEVSVSLQKNSSGKPIGFRGISRDITERKQAEEVLKVSEAQYRWLSEHITDGVWLLDMNLKPTYQSPSMEKLTGFTHEELMELPMEKRVTPESFKLAFELFLELLPRIMADSDYNPLRTLELECCCKDGTILWTENKLSGIRDENGKPVSILAEVRDITERKQAEEALRESEYKYKSLIENIPDIIFTVDLEGKITFVSQRIKEILGYENAEMINMIIFNFIPEEDHQRAMESLQKGMKGEKIRHFQIPMITKSGERLFFECSFSRVYKDGAVVGAQGTAVDITERKRAEEERQQSFERMRKALRATVQSISMIVEMKDPYTSGHQQRVSDLARSIATEMGLSADRRDFIRTASAIHDIGKISIPSEILSKPTKLTDLEFNLIKTHVRAGYDILKDIEFPWPVADVVLQHHERMNGSGYPHGLKGDDILLEARILAVADVVEAIASHRPYRPALGIDLALEEISGNKGILYDADAVDACLKLFREKGYTLVLKKA